MEQPLTWKEKYAALVLFIIGSALLLLEVAAVLSSKAVFSTQTETTVSFNKSEVFAHTRTFIIIVFSIVAAVALRKKKRIGWILGLPILLISALIAGYLIYFGKIMYGTAISLIAALILICILAAMGFLLTKGGREKYKVGKHSVLPTLVFLMALGAIFFFLQ